MFMTIGIILLIIIPIALWFIWGALDGIGEVLSEIHRETKGRAPHWD